MSAKDSEMSSSVELKGVRDTQIELELPSSKVDTRIPDKKKDHSSLVKILWFVVVLALAVAVAAVVAVVVVINKSNDIDKLVSLKQSAAQIGKTTGKAATTKSIVKTTMATSIPEDNSVCMKPECVLTAARLYKNMDQTVHPCNDFYQYACGGWIKKNPILDDTSITLLSVLTEDVDVSLKGLLETISTDGELEAIMKAKNMYISCMDEELIEQRGLQPLDLIYDTFGKWPLLHNSWNESEFDLIDSIVAMKEYGFSPLIAQQVIFDFKNSTVRKIQLYRPGVNLPTGNGSVPHSRTYIVDLAEALGAENMTQVEQDVDDIFEFANAVVNLPREPRADPKKRYNPMTINDIYMNISNKFDWMRLIGGIMNITGVEIPIPREETILVRTPTYLRKIVDLIEMTPPRVLANFLIAEQILHILPYLPEHIKDISREYKETVNGIQAEEVPARWRYCLRLTRIYLPNAVGRLYVDNFFDEGAKAIVLDMVANLRSAFNDQLIELDWLDDETRRLAKEKADAVTEMIGYSERLVKNDTYLNEQYEEFQYDPTTYFENIMMSRKVLTVQALRKLREPVVQEDPPASPTSLTVQYDLAENAVAITAAFIQPPMFFKHYPKSMNYGGIGFFIGHEITHGFDNNGRLHDKNGDLKTWWNKSIIEEFEAKAQCFVEQYSNYTVPEIDMKVDGELTLGENIADNGGLKQAFTAYRKWVRKQGKEEPKLPGLNLNHNQLFFLNFAQIWCYNRRDEDAEDQILDDVHSPGIFRTLGTLQNSKEFSEAFNCPKSSDMNPQKKCRVW